MACSPEYSVFAWARVAPGLAALFVTLVHAVGAQAQAPFPPLAASQATSAQAALAALSVPQAEPSGYVLLDLPEVAAPGKIKGRIGSEYPGTSMLLLLRTGPEFGPDVKAPAPKPRSNTKGAAPAPVRAGPQPMPSLIVARKLAPGEPALLTVEFDITRTQRYAVYAFAQGRWFIAEREVKVGQDGSHR